MRGITFLFQYGGLHPLPHIGFMQLQFAVQILVYVLDILKGFSFTLLPMVVEKLVERIQQNETWRPT
jgi:hypothetical protein